MKALEFIIYSIVQLYLLVLLLRFWLPWLRADFRNPVAQGILKLTSPLIVPLRRVIPSVGRLDTATVLAAIVIQAFLIWLLLALPDTANDRGLVPNLPGAAAAPIPILTTAIVDLALLSLRLFMFAIFIYVIMSWIAPGSYNPATAIVSTLVLPILRPFSSLLPKPGGIDISPVIVIILLQATIILVGDMRPIPI